MVRKYLWNYIEKKHKYMATPLATTPSSASSSSETIQLGQNTILTEKVKSKAEEIDEFIHLDIFTGSFLTGIVLTVICIVYLFNTNTEYICWIFGIVLLVLLPVTWLGDFMMSSNSKYKWYIGFCLFFGIILNFAAILMVILYTTRLNNRIKEYKSNEVVKPGQKPSNFHINPDILSNYKMIKIMFTTNLVLCITIIMNFFVYEGENKVSNSKKESVMATNMYWWYKLIHDIFVRIDQFIITFLEYLPINGFIKMFLLFCGGFLFFFFSFFVKLKTTWKDPKISDDPYMQSQPKDYIQNLIKEFGYGLNGVYPANNFDIVDFPNILVETAGPVDFAALSSFFLSIAFAVIVWFISLLIPKQGVNSLKSISSRVGLKSNSNEKKINGGNNFTSIISGLSNISSGVGLGLGLNNSIKTNGGPKTNSIPYILIGVLVSFCISFAVLIFTYCGTASFVYLLYTTIFLLALILGGNNFGISIILCFLFTINFLILYYGNLDSSKNDKSSNNKTSQNYILFCLCFLFSLLGTPVAFMVFELLGRILGFSFAGDLKSYFFPNSTTNKCEVGDFPFGCQYRVILATILLCASFLGLLFGIFSYGTSFGKPETQSTWMSGNGNSSQVKIFVITILSIMVGWFFALHLKFNMFSFVYESIIQPARFVLFFLAPITVLGLAITQIVIASISAKLVGSPIKTDG